MKMLITGDFVPQERIVTQRETDDFECLDQEKTDAHNADYAILNFDKR